MTRSSYTMVKPDGTSEPTLVLDPRSPPARTLAGRDSPPRHLGDRCRAHQGARCQRNRLAQRAPRQAVQNVWVRRRTQTRRHYQRDPRRLQKSAAAKAPCETDTDRERGASPHRPTDVAEGRVSQIAVVAVMCKPHRCPHIAMTGNICVCVRLIATPFVTVDGLQVLSRWT